MVEWVHPNHPPSEGNRWMQCAVIEAVAAPQIRRHFELPDEATEEQWAEAGRRLRDVSEGWHWCVGDWLVAGLDRWGESRYAAAERVTGLNYSTLRHYVCVARRFPQGQRHEASFSVHAEVAKLEREAAHEILAIAAKEGLSVRAVRLRVNRETRVEPEPAPAPPPGVSNEVRRPSTAPMLPGRAVRSYEARPLNEMGRAIVDDLKRRRQALGHSLQELDHLTGWGPGQAAHYEAHDRNPTLHALEEWCEALGVGLAVVQSPRAA